MKAFVKDLLVEALRADSSAMVLNAEELTNTLLKLCDATLPRKLEPSIKQQPVYY